MMLARLRRLSAMAVLSSAAFSSVLFFHASAAFACSTFALSGGNSTLTAKNFDWQHADHGMFVVNKRRVAKCAFDPSGRTKCDLDEVSGRASEPSSGAKAFGWTSRFGSVSFHQHGREFPLGGMNEKGLVVEIMWLDSSVYEAPDARPSLNELQWIQYQLDLRESVPDLLAHLGEVRLAPIFAQIHYLVCDSARRCASIEFIDGKRVVHNGADLPVRGLTNDTYVRSLDALRELGEKPDPASGSSLDRFVRGARLQRSFQGGSAQEDVKAGFALLASLEAGDTVLSAVWDQARSVLTFRSKRERALKTLDFKDLSKPGKDYFSCSTPALTLDLGQAEGGEVFGRMREYSRAIQHANAALGMRLLPPEQQGPLVELATDFPDTGTRCLN